MLLADTLFRLMPRFKVRAEGDLVRMEDQITIESVKTPSRFLNVSAIKFKSGVEAGCHEVDLSIRPASFSILPHYTPNESDLNFLKACLSFFFPFCYYHC